MSFISLLLRLVLCVGLIANGAGVARASAHVHNVHAAPLAGPDRAAASGGCHGDAVTAASANRQPAAGAHASVVADPPHGMQDAVLQPDPDAGTGPSDCCSGSVCACACVQHAPIGSASAAWPTPAPTPVWLAITGRSQRGDPRLGHLIRPPIG